MTSLAPIAAVVAMIVGHPVPVQCTPINPHDAGLTTFVNGAPTLIQLQPGVCWDERMPVEDQTIPAALANALLVVIHEAEHVALDSTNEAQVQCAAVRAFPSVLARSVVWPSDPSPLRMWLIHASEHRIDATVAGLNSLLPPAYHEQGCN